VKFTRKILIFFAAFAVGNADTIITTTLFSASPTGQVTAGVTSPLAEFEFLNDSSSGVQLNTLRFLLTESGSAGPWTTAGNVAADISSIQLFDDTGNQVASTTPTTCAGAILSPTSFDCSFVIGRLAFVFPPDSLRVLTIAVGLQSETDLASIRASLLRSVATNAKLLDDGGDTLRVPLGRVDGNLLGVNPDEEAEVPEISSVICCGIGLFLIGVYQLRRKKT
jgi:hypothetical protein